MSISELCPGNYTVTVSDQNGCTGTLTNTICCCNQESGILDYACTPGSTSTVSPVSISSFFSRHPTGPNQKDGSIDIKVTGGSGRYAYNWNGPSSFQSNNQDLWNIDYGVYCVTITDGCTEDNRCFTLKDCESQEWSVTASIGVACSGYDVGSIEIESISGAPGPYTFRWSNGKRSRSIYDLSTGSYCVTISDKDQCKTTKCWYVPTEEIKELWQGCTFVSKCGEEVIEEVEYPTFERTDPNNCNFVQIICRGNNEIVGSRNVGVYYSLISDCRLGRYNNETHERCGVYNGFRKTFRTSGCRYCPNGAYCGRVQVCDFNTPDGPYRNIIQYTDLLIVGYIGVFQSCQQINSCRGGGELCRCNVSGIYCQGNVVGEESNAQKRYSMCDQLELDKNFNNIIPFFEDVLKNESITNGKDFELIYDDVIVVDSLNDVSYSNEGMAPLQLRSEIHYPSSTEEGDIRIYPNPTNGHLYIEAMSKALKSEDIRIELFDLQGRLLLNKPWNLNNQKKLKIDLSAINTTGIYILHITGSEINKSVKITKIND